MNTPPSHNLKKNAGFTLIETLVAITILLVAIAGPLTLATRSFLNAFVARDQLIASYLAEDAIEYVRYIRDSNFLSGANWLTGLSACISSSCRIDTIGGIITACSSGTCRMLQYNPNTGFYGYASGSDSIFRRTVNVSKISDDEYVLEATVEWQTRSLQKSFTTKEHIYNWLGS